MKEDTPKGFATNQNRGFKMTFDNGVTASVQWGPGNYCEARNYSYASYDAPMKAPSQCWESANAEVAAWDKNGKWITKKLFPGLKADDVVGYLTPDKVLAFLNKCAKFKEKKRVLRKTKPKNVGLKRKKNL